MSSASSHGTTKRFQNLQPCWIHSFNVLPPVIVEATLDPSWLFPAGAIEEEEAGPRLAPDLELVSFFLLPQRKGTARPEAGESLPMDAAHIM